MPFSVQLERLVLHVAAVETDFARCFSVLENRADRELRVRIEEAIERSIDRCYTQCAVHNFQTKVDSDPFVGADRADVLTVLSHDIIDRLQSLDRFLVDFYFRRERREYLRHCPAPFQSSGSALAG